MKYNKNKKYAFTMLELVFVIVVAGILVATIVPRFDRNNLQEATNQLISHIRYAQHLAMIDDKFNDKNTTWFRSRWQIFFSNASSSKSYIIFSDITQDGNPNNSNTGVQEVARNPLDNTKYLIGVHYHTFYGGTKDERLSNNLNLKDKYGINDISVTGGSTSSSANRIVFDSLGRPYRGNTNSSSSNSINSLVDKLATSKIYIKLCRETCTNPKQTKNNQNEEIIIIEPQTGYTHIL